MNYFNQIVVNSGLSNPQLFTMVERHSCLYDQQAGLFSEAGRIYRCY